MAQRTTYIDKFHSKLVYVGLTQAHPNKEKQMTGSESVCMGLTQNYGSWTLCWFKASFTPVHIACK